jgi:uncharacterized protein YacL
MNTATPRIRALTRTLGLVLSSMIGAGLMIISLETLGMATTSLIIATAVLIYMIYAFYQIELSRQETIENLNKIQADFDAKG